LRSGQQNEKIIATALGREGATLTIADIDARHA